MRKSIKRRNSDSWWQPTILTQLLCLFKLTHGKFCFHLFTNGNRSDNNVASPPIISPSSPPISPQKLQFDLTLPKGTLTNSSPCSCFTADTLCYSESSEALSSLSTTIETLSMSSSYDTSPSSASS